MNAIDFKESDRAIMYMFMWSLLPITNRTFYGDARDATLLLGAINETMDVWLCKISIIISIILSCEYVCKSCVWLEYPAYK